MTPEPTSNPTAAALRRQAEASLRKRQKHQAGKPAETKPTADSQRLLHELQVHQVELEMQNAELHEARDRMETLLEKYTDLYDFSPVSYFTLGREGKVQLVNLTGASLVGLPRAKLIGHSFTMLIVADQRQAFRTFLDEIFASDTKQKGDYHLLLPDQTSRVVKIRAMRSPSGQDCSIVLVDITERVEAEAKVHTSEVRYRRLFETAHDGVLLMDPATRLITDANPFMTTLLGYTHDELVGKELYEIGLLKDEVASQVMFRELKKTHQVRYEDLPLESEDGRHQEVEVVANLYQENGRAVIQCNIRDITERKQKEQALHKSELRLSLGVKVSDLALVEVDYLTDKKHLSAEAARLFGLGDEPMVVPRAVVHALMHPDDLPALQPLITASLDPAGDGGLAMDHRIIRPSGEVRWLRVREKVFFDAPPDARRPHHSIMALLDITAEKMASEALRTSEERMRLATEATAVGIWEWSILTNEVRWDAQMFRIYGLTPSPGGMVPYTAWSTAVLPEDLPQQEAVLQDTIRRRGRSSRTFRILRADDHECRIIQCFEAIRTNAAGQAEWVVGTNLDITERVRAEQDIRLKGTALAAVANAIFITDREGIMQYTNPAFTQMSGYAAEEALGKNASLVKSGVHPKSFFQQLWQTLLSGQNWSGQITNRHKNQQLYVSEQSISPVKDASGQISHFVSVQRDITERLKAEETLRRSEALFTAMIDKAPFGVYVVDAAFRIQQINPKALPTFASVHPLIGRDFAEITRHLWPKRAADKLLARFRHTLKTGEPYQSPEFTEKRRDTHEQEVYEWQLQRVTLPAGERGVVCFFNNITERKRAEWVRRRLDILTASNQKLEEEIVQRQAVEKSLKKSEQDQRRLLLQAQQMQKQLRHFSHQIITAQEDERKRISRELHDVIAQTLVGINVHLGTLTRAAEGTPKSLLVKIQRTQQLVEKAADTVHQFARELRPTVLDDVGLIPALEAHLKCFMEETGVRVALKVTAGIEARIGTRRTTLFRIAQEALTNVARHAKASTVTIAIESLPDGTVRMEITDDGRGFEADGKSGAARNKRLGLLGMRERVEMINGTFNIDSNPGGPTTVRVEIPMS